MALPPSLAEWHARGARPTVFGHRVFTVVAEPPAGAVTGLPLVVLHGFPSSSFDFRQSLGRLASHRRVVVHDHLGFGFSEKPADYSYSLLEQAEVAVALWKDLGITRAHVLAHDYGTTVATELLARRARGLLPFEIASLTLTNGSVHAELARLTPSQKLLKHPLLGPAFARLAQPRLFKAQLRRILGRPDSVSEDELEAMWQGMVQDGGRERLPQLAGYMAERARFRARWIGALGTFDGPVHVLWGRRDPVAVEAIAERLSRDFPNVRSTWFDDLGHYPMLEAPDRYAQAAAAFVERVEKR